MSWPIPPRCHSSCKKLCGIDIYPAIRLLLSILGTPLVSSAAAEKSFSALRFLKSDLRTIMTESRPHGLSLIYIHSCIVIRAANSNSNSKELDLFSELELENI